MAFHQGPPFLGLPRIVLLSPSPAPNYGLRGQRGQRRLAIPKGVIS